MTDAEKIQKAIEKCRKQLELIQENEIWNMRRYGTHIGRPPEVSAYESILEILEGEQK